MFVALVLYATCKQQYIIQFELAGLKAEHDLNENLNGANGHSEKSGDEVVLAGSVLLKTFSLQSTLNTFFTKRKNPRMNFLDVCAFHFSYIFCSCSRLLFCVHIL